MQLAALEEWLAVAEKKYAESPEDFTKTMTDFIMNWIGELAGAWVLICGKWRNGTKWTPS